MPTDRYFHDGTLHIAQPINLEGPEAHHLTHVMRARVAERVELVNGRGQLAQAQIVAISKKEVQLTPFQVETADTPKEKLILAQAIPKMNRLETILEKVTELGVTDIWLFPGVHSEKEGLSANQTERAHLILISAMKQCGRLFLPQLQICQPLKKWQSTSLPAFFGDLRAEAPNFEEALKGRAKGEGLLFFIGPESGFSEEEIEILEQLGTKGVKLHQNILRTDTAAIAAAYLMSRALDKKEIH